MILEESPYLPLPVHARHITPLSLLILVLGTSGARRLRLGGIPACALGHPLWRSGHLMATGFGCCSRLEFPPSAPDGG